MLGAFRFSNMAHWEPTHREVTHLEALFFLERRQHWGPTPPAQVFRRLLIRRPLPHLPASRLLTAARDRPAAIDRS